VVSEALIIGVLPVGLASGLGVTEAVSDAVGKR